MSILNLLKSKKNEIRNIAYKHGVTNISLFGSVLRNEDNENSDIDFLIEFEENRTLFDLIRLKEDLEILIGKEVDVVTKDSLHWTIKDQILSEVEQI